MLTGEIKILDHGYIKLIETWGSDEAIICAARMSTGKGHEAATLIEEAFPRTYTLFAARAAR